MSAPSDPSADIDRLAQEFLERARRGEAPSIEEYARAHPSLADDLYELFPVLAVVEGLKGPSLGGVSALPEADAAAAGKGPALPEVVGAYRLVREIGRGGMGSVHEAHPTDGDEDERVALKVVHRHLLQSPEYVARFLREAEAGERIEHANVVRTLGTGLVSVEGDEVPYLVLEYVEGQNLRSLLDEVEVVPERLCRHVGRRLAEALAAIHAAGLVHRDVKPENVVITADETVKLMDLGVAVLQEEAARLSRTGQFVGSLLYAAPEQLLGDTPDPSWDLYALGLLLYELSTGRHPARALGARWLDRHDPLRRASSPLEANPRLSPFYDALVETLLAPVADQRPTSAEEVARILDEGEESAWWQERRAVGPSPGLRLQGLDRPTRFVGRGDDVVLLDRLLGEVREGQGRVAFVAGEAGIGKTRLLHEWLASTQEGTNPPQAIVVPHGPGVVGGDEGGLAAALYELLGPANLEGRLAELLASRVALVEPLAQHLTGARVSTGGPTLDAISLDGAYVHLLAALARRGPLVIAAEDLHYASEEARNRFLLFSRALMREAVLLIGTTRTVPAPTWAAELDRLPHVVRHTLDGLDTQACRALVREAAKACPHLEQSVGTLAERSDRNPFLLLEFVRDCMQRHPVSDDDLAIDGAIPPTIRGFLTGRLDALDAEERELLEAASCCGYEFDPVVVALATDAGRIAALKLFGRLERQHGLLRPAGRHYVFQHHLVQELLYSEMHAALKETYHGALGDALEQVRTTLLEGPRALALTTHFLEGGQAERARPHARRALEHLAAERHDYVRATDLARRTLEIEGLLGGEERAYVLSVLSGRLVSNARYEEAEAPLTEALQRARETDAGGLEIDLLLQRSSAAAGQGRRDEMHDAFRVALVRARAIGDRGREANVLSRLGLALQDEKRTDEAEVCFREGVEALRDHPDPYWEARLTKNLARMEVHRANFDEGERLLRRSRHLAHAAGDLVTEVENYATLGQLAARKGQYVEAIDFGTRSVELGRQLGLEPTGLLLSNLVYILTDLGRYEEAADRAVEAIALAAQGTDLLASAHAHLHRGRLRLALGQLAEARADLRTSFDEAKGVALPEIISAAMFGLARSLCLHGRVVEAARLVDEVVPILGPKAAGRANATRALILETEGRYREAQEIYAKMISTMRAGSRGERSYLFAVGRTLHRSGQAEAAAEHLRAARTWGRASGLVRHAVLAEAHLAALGQGDVLAARVALEQHESALPMRNRIEAHLLLWEATGETAHLDAARETLDRLRESAPAEDRASMVENVDLFRRVVAG